MRVVVGADHAGFALKEKLIAYLRELEHQVKDVGTYSTAPADYPDCAEAVGIVVRGGQADRGIVICGSGVGTSIAVNKLPGIRAGLCHDTYSAHQGVEHDDMNVLVLGARVIGTELARELVRAFLAAVFSNEERHCRRLDKLRALETRYGGMGDSESGDRTDDYDRPRQVESKSQTGLRQVKASPRQVSGKSRQAKASRR